MSEISEERLAEWEQESKQQPQFYSDKITLQLIAEIRRLRAENDDLKHLVHQAIPGQFDVCGNSYVNAWLEKWLRLAQAMGVYKGPLVGVCNELRDAWMESQENQT